MARPKIAAGEIGQVQVTRLANAKWRARARMRNDSGDLVQLRAEGPTESAARDELLSRAKTLTTHTKAIVTATSAIQEAAAAWLPTVKVRAENGTLSWSPNQNHETTVRLTLVPAYASQHEKVEAEEENLTVVLTGVVESLGEEAAIDGAAFLTAQREAFTANRAKDDAPRFRKRSVTRAANDAESSSSVHAQPRRLSGSPLKKQG